MGTSIGPGAGRGKQTILHARLADAIRGLLHRAAGVGDHLVMNPGPPAYEARYGWTRGSGWGLVIGFAFIAVALILPMEIVIRVLVIGIFGFLVVSILAGIVGRQVAFRVDQAGVTLGGSPLRYRSATRFIPWEDIARITIWNRALPFGGPLSYVGLSRRPGARPLSKGGSGRADGPAYMAPVPGIAAGAARSASMWAIDHDRLAAAVAVCAPNVRVVDART